MVTKTREKILAPLHKCYCLLLFLFTSLIIDKSPSAACKGRTYGTCSKRSSQTLWGLRGVTQIYWRSLINLLLGMCPMYSRKQHKLYMISKFSSPHHHKISARSSNERFSTILIATRVGFCGWNLIHVTVLIFEPEV